MSSRGYIAWLKQVGSEAGLGPITWSLNFYFLNLEGFSLTVSSAVAVYSQANLSCYHWACHSGMSAVRELNRACSLTEGIGVPGGWWRGVGGGVFSSIAAANIPTHTTTHTHTHTHACTNARTYARKHGCMHTLSQAPEHTYTHAHSLKHRNTHTYTDTHTHANTNTHTLPH